MGQTASATINHDFIKKWVEERGGRPAAVKGRGTADDPGILRIDFPGYSGEGTLQAISWDRWFRAFDEKHLAFLHQDRIDHEPSRFNKLVDRDSVELDESGFGTAKRGLGGSKHARARAPAEEIFEDDEEAIEAATEGEEGGDEALEVDIDEAAAAAGGELDVEIGEEAMEALDLESEEGSGGEEAGQRSTTGRPTQPPKRRAG